MQAEPCAKLADFSPNNSIPLSHHRESQRRKIMKWLEREGLGRMEVGMSKVRGGGRGGTDVSGRAENIGLRLAAVFLNLSSHQGRGDRGRKQ